MTTHPKCARLDLALSFTVVSPSLFRGLPGKLMGLDASALRDEQGRPIIPADQVRGCLRDAFEDLAAAGAGLTTQELLDLFGRQSPAENQAGTANEPSRARLTVSDLTARAVDLTKRFETTRIAVDDDTGAVAEGMMQVLELVAPFGTEIAFEGLATLFAPVGSENAWEQRIDRAMKLITAIGAVKSAGYGEVVKASATLTKAAAVTIPAAAASGPARRRYRVTFDRPVLVDADWIADNAMAGSAVIPGAVFKGALAQALSYAGEDPAKGAYGTSLSALSIGHAFPESEHRGKPGLRPVPLSLVSLDGKDFGDALLGADGQGAMMEDKAVLFVTDWKSDWLGNAARRLNYAPVDDPPLLARTHTAISHEGVAKDQDLYTTLARSVRRKDGAGKWHDRGWIVDVDLSAVPAAGLAKAQSLLALMEQGLDGIGKTGARAHFEPLGDAPQDEPKEIAGRPGEYAVMLLTPAYLLDARKLVAEQNGVAHWRKTAREAYQEYWGSALPGAKLESFFASQRYTGGYLARRRRAHGRDHYYPFLVTEAGSVFRLSNVRGAVFERLKALCGSGLPAATLDGTQATWENCPYVPENGYGRITADHLSGPVGSALTQAVAYG